MAEPSVGDPAAAGEGVPALPGPADREHFLDAQRRSRRAGRRAAVFAPLAVAAAGVPLCAVLTPALYAPLLVVGRVAEAMGRLPPAWGRALHEVAHLLPDLWARLRGAGVVPWGTLALLLVVPGAVVMLLAWAVIRVRLRRAWVGRALRRLRARRLDLGVPAERQLANLVEEVAVAAAVRPPRVVVAELSEPNALVLGLDVNDATVVVTRGALEALDRAQLQAVIAHAVASVANGDLRVAATFMSVFHAWGLLALLTDAPFTGRHRRALRHVVRALRSRGRGPRARRARRRAAELLLTRATSEGGAFANDDPITEVASGHPLVGCLVKLPLLLTLGLASITFRATLELATLLVFGPVMAWLWRARRRLADATAVELTRDPEALAGAVRRMAGPAGVTPRAYPLSFLCFVRATPTPTSARDPLTHAPAITEFVVGMQPDPEDRLARLAALGAADASVPRAARTPPDTARDVRDLLVWGTGTIVLVAFLLALNLATTAALLWLVWALLTAVLTTLPARLAARAGHG
jgi:Zn-dependent protease with chaperone function